MATERRGFLVGVAALGAASCGLPVAGRALAAPSHGRAALREGSGPVSLATAWSDEGAHRVGVWKAAGPAISTSALTSLAPACALDVPTRAHGLCREPAGTILTAARRPGDWLLRWDPVRGKAVRWCWIEPDRAFNGHVLLSADGRRVFTTETDLGSGAGLIGVRDAASLNKLAEWPTHGMDPHEMLWLPSPSDPARGQLLVANGGIPVRPETGRVKVDLDRMDSSLVRLETDDGRVSGQWRVGDARLSLRHLAALGGEATAAGGAAAHGAPLIGIAMQAEHDDPSSKAAAPLLALWDGSCLRVAQQPPGAGLAGYAGDIAALPGGWAVSATRAGQVALWTPSGAWREALPLAEACALAAGPSGPLWAAGPQQAWWLALEAGAAAAPEPQPQPLRRMSGPRIDNHWIVL